MNEQYLDRLIEALAIEIVRGYLTPKPAPAHAHDVNCTERVLHVQAKAA